MPQPANPPVVDASGVRAGAPHPGAPRGALRVEALIAATLFLGGYLGWLIGLGLHWWTPPRSTEPVTETVMIGLALFAGIAGLQVSSLPSLPRAGGRAWKLVGIAQFFTVIVCIGWLMPTYGITAFRDVGRVAAITCNTLLLSAFVIFPGERRDDAGRTAFWLDLATVACATTVLAWHLLLRSALEASHAGVGQTIHTLLYPVYDVVIFFASVTALLRRPRADMLMPLRLLALSCLLTTTADVLVNMTHPSIASFVENATNAVYAIVEWLVAAGAYAQTRKVRVRDMGSARAARRQAMEMSALPYFAIGAVFLALLGEVFKPGGAEPGSPLRALVFGAVAVTAIVVARQVAVQRRNATLVADRLAREAHFRALVQHSSDVILVLDSDGIVREASPAVERLTGHAPADVVGRPLALLGADGDGSSIRADLAQVSASLTPRPPAPCEWRVRHADGSVRWLEALCSNLLSDRAVNGIVVNGRDVSERKALEAELTHRAYHDPLTGLVNRSRFRGMVAAALDRRSISMKLLGRCADAGHCGISVLYIDLDGFKPVNDSLGHAAGDQVLVEVAERLRSATRGTDTIARLGGDEFAILLERTSGAEADARIVAERVLAGIKRQIVLDGIPVTVGASVGIACIAGDGTACSPDQLLREADLAMYAAKARGRDCYELATVHG